MQQQNKTTMFVAPTEGLEMELIDFCTEDIKLPFSDFWYDWFSSSRVKTTGNHNIHINTNTKLDTKELKEKFLKVRFVESIFEVIEIDMHNIENFDVEFRYQYVIHFKSNCFEPNRLSPVKN